MQARVQEMSNSSSGGSKPAEKKPAEKKAYEKKENGYKREGGWVWEGKRDGGKYKKNFGFSRGQQMLFMVEIYLLKQLLLMK